MHYIDAILEIIDREAEGKSVEERRELFDQMIDDIKGELDLKKMALDDEGAEEDEG